MSCMTQFSYSFTDAYADDLAVIGNANDSETLVENMNEALELKI